MTDYLKQTCQCGAELQMETSTTVLPFDLATAFQEAHRHCTAPPAITAANMKAASWAADSVLAHHLTATGATTAKTELLQRLLGVLGPDERSLAEHESRCAEALAAFTSNLSMRAQAVASPISTYPRQDSEPSAVESQDAATSSSGSSEHIIHPFLSQTREHWDECRPCREVFCEWVKNGYGGSLDQQLIDRLRSSDYSCERMCLAAENGGTCRCSQLFNELPAMADKVTDLERQLAERMPVTAVDIGAAMQQAREAETESAEADIPVDTEPEPMPDCGCSVSHRVSKANSLPIGERYEWEAVGDHHDESCPLHGTVRPYVAFKVEPELTPEQLHKVAADVDACTCTGLITRTDCPVHAGAPAQNQQRPQLFDVKTAPGVVEVDNTPKAEVVAAEDATCECIEAWWSKVRHFNARLANEAHHFTCPMYKKGGHYFELPRADQTDGSGIYRPSCIWCGENKVMSPYGEDPTSSQSPLAAKSQELKGRREAAREAREAELARLYTPEEREAMRTVTCVDCGAETSGQKPRCRPCGVANGKAKREAEKAAAGATA